MKLHIFSARKVVQDLSRDEISHEHRAYYLLAGFVFSLIIGYCTLTGTNASRTWLGFYEFLILLLITVYGFRNAISSPMVILIACSFRILSAFRSLWV